MMRRSWPTWKRADPSKRELFLAGNRRGALIPLKEPTAHGHWETRWVNAYCPRGFTAIRTPHDALQTRVLIIPLRRTADAKRGNADPADDATWPESPRGLQDDLWATALMLLAEAVTVWAELGSEADTVGREFELWRALMTTARLLEKHGVAGLETRMRTVMRAYQQEKAGLLGEDRIVRVVRALITLMPDTMDTSDVSDTMTSEVEVSATQIAETIKANDADEAETDVEAEQRLQEHWATPSRIGRILSRLRIQRGRESDKKRSRKWVTTVEELTALARAYGVPHNAADTPDSTAPPSPVSVPSGHSVPSVRPEGHADYEEGKIC